MVITIDWGKKKKAKNKCKVMAVTLLLNHFSKIMLQTLGGPIFIGNPELACSTFIVLISLYKYIHPRALDNPLMFNLPALRKCSRKLF